MIKMRILKRVFYSISRLFLLLTFVSLVPPQTPSQQNQSSKQTTSKILFNQIPTELGLSQNVITSSLQDKTGFLWFGTKDGLNRFDGYQFKIYRQNPNDSNSISDSSINVIFEDKEGRMWVGTENGLNLFDRTHEIFYRVLPNPNNPNSLSHQQIRSIAEDKEGAIWIATPNGLNKLELSEGENPLQNAQFTVFKRTPEGLDDSNVDRVLVDESGVVFVKSDSGKIFSLTAEANNKNYRIKSLNSLKDDYLMNYCLGRNGKIWKVGKKGIYELDIKTEKVIFHQFDAVLLKAGVTVIHQIIEDRSGKLWFGGYWGLARFNQQTEKFDHFPSSDKENPEIVNPLLSFGVNSILEDGSGAMWFGSNGKGLTRYDRQAERFAHSKEQNSKLSLWRGNSIRVLFETTDGTLLFAAAGGGLFQLNRETGDVFPLKFNPSEVPEDPGAYTILQDKYGWIWCGSPGGLLKFNLQNSVAADAKFYSLEPATEKFANGKTIFKVFEDRNGNLWVINTNKLYSYNRETDSFAEAYLYDERKVEERPFDNYVEVYEDQSGIFWMGTTDGFVRFDPQNKEIKRYRNNPQDVNSLSHNVVRTIAPDPFEPNILWLGTKGGGLNRFDKQTETFSVLTEKDGLPNNVIYGILSDEKGNLWMSTNNGISRFDPRARIFKNFDKKDGLQDNEFNSCAFFKSKSGELLFGGINGFNAFYPIDVKDNPNPPPVVLTDFQILNQPVSFKTKDSPLKQTITETKEIILNYEQRFFSFEFAALDFAEPSKNQYAYQLEGFDKDLVEVGTRRTAFYTNVPPGTYTFRVIASNNDGVWNREGAVIRLTVLPPFWQTWWFLILVTILGSSLIFFIYHRRLWQLEKEKNMQEAFSRQLIEVQENDRKRIAAELHDELGQSLLIIKNRAFLGEKATEKAVENHEKINSAREQFGEISDSAAEALEQVREIAYYLRPSQLERLGLTSAIEEMIERVSESSDIDFDCELADLDGVFSKQDEINFYRIVQESLNNIIKHSNAKSAMIRIENDAEGVELVVKDNGQGFAVEAVSDKNRGFGMKGIAERARLLGGTYSIRSIFGEGTIVTVKVEKLKRLEI